MNLPDVTLTELVSAAVKYNSSLKTLPYVFFTELGKKNGFHVRTGLYGKEKTGHLQLEGNMRPYHTGGPDDLGFDIVFEEIETRLCEDYRKFEIAKLRDTVFAKGVIDLASFKKTELGKMILALRVELNLSSIRKNIWKASYNSEGTQTSQMFDGFDTILAKYISDGKLSTSNQNLSTLTDSITADSAVDILKAEYRKLPEELKDENIVLYCSQDVYEAYCDGYEIDRGHLHDKKLGQTILHGSDDKCIIKPQSFRSAESPLLFSVPNNLTIGLGGKSTKELLKVREDNNIKFAQFIHMLFFGTAISCVDHRLFRAVQQVQS